MSEVDPGQTGAYRRWVMWAVSGIGVAPTLLDARVVPGSPFVAELPAAHAAFAYVLEGEALVGAPGTRVGRGELAVLGPGAALRAETREGARLLVVAAKAIGEPIARRGPFVMNTEAELDQAFDDYRSGRLTSG